jgi:predicted branched-subunit amino acid permease
MSTSVPGVLDAPAERTTTTAREWDEARRGALAMAPLIVGYAPFALVVGSILAAHGDHLAGWAGIWLIFGGSAQLATVRALDDGGVALAIATGLLVNARLVVYTASLAAHWRTQPRWFRLLGAALVIDPTWMAAERRTAEPGTDRDMRQFFLGAGLTLGAAWCALVTAGMILGDRAAGWIDLEVTVPLCLLALVGPRLLERNGRATVLVAAAVAAATMSLPAGSGILLAIVVGVAAGLVTSGSRP